MLRLIKRKSVNVSFPMEGHICHVTLFEAEALQIDYINNDIPSDVCSVHQTNSPQQPATAIPDNTLPPIPHCSPSKRTQQLASSLGDLVHVREGTHTTPQSSPCDHHCG